MATDKGRWITTDTGKRIHLDEDGNPDIGNPYVTQAMKNNKSSSKGGRKVSQKRYSELSSDIADIEDEFKDVSKSMSPHEDYKYFMERVSDLGDFVDADDVMKAVGEEDNPKGYNYKSGIDKLKKALKGLSVK